MHWSTRPKHANNGEGRSMERIDDFDRVVTAPQHAYFIIPVFNEELNVERVLQDLQRFESAALTLVKRTSLVFVDDGSTDSTQQRLAAADRANLVVLSHRTNQGPGAAFQTGFRYLLDHGLAPDDLVITLEGD